MGYFPTNGCDISSTKYSTLEKDIIQQVLNGNAFTNPVSEAIGSVNTAISGVQGLLGSVTFPDVFGGLSSAVSGLSTQVDTYKTHSDRVSGANLDSLGPNDEPGLLGLYGIASAFNSAQESMIGGVVDNFSEVFNSILGPADSAIKNVTDSINNKITNFITDNIGVTSGDYPVGFETKLAELTSEISGANTNLGTLISTDNSNYSTASNYVKKFGLGNMILGSQSDPCFGGNLMKNVVCNSSLQQKINELPI
ncbi:MAG: hypothetical protein H8D80_01810 [Proteobacteria bacterium]|nr:hypothetical protein [Pseudomonadota bacterium]